MSKTFEYYYLTGKGEWANNLLTPDLQYKNWNVKLTLTPDSYNDFMKLKEKSVNSNGEETEGILNEVKSTEDGYKVVLKRPMFKDYGRGDEPLTPPEILDENNQPWKKDVYIGNGSDLTVKVERYTYKKPFGKGRGSAIRLVSARVDNLVPFERDSFTPAQEKAVKGLTDQPKQLF